MQERRRVLLFEEAGGYENQYFTIVSEADNNAIGWKTGYANAARTISISTDNGKTWTDVTATTSGVTLATLNTGDTLLVRGTNTAYYDEGGSWNNPRANMFTSSGNFHVEGNIMSLVYGKNFKGQTELTAANTFRYMFYNCSKLTTAENLIMPATTLTNYCYDRMFSNCTILTTAPKLPATTLVTGCYSYMFNGSRALNYVKCLAVDHSASSCTSNWLGSVASSGTFYKASDATWATGTSGIPSGWTTTTFTLAFLVSEYIVEPNSTVTAVCYMSDTSYASKLRYSIADTTYATIDASSGLVTAKSVEGTTTITAYLLDEPDIEPATCTLRVAAKVDLSNATITLPSSSYTYTGSAITPAPTVTANGSTVASSNYTTTYSNNVNAGTATVTVTANDGTQYKGSKSKTFTISKATPTYTAPTAKTNIGYTGSAQPLVNAGSTSHGTIKYSLNGTSWSTSVPTGTNAGTYTVYWKLDGDSNHTSISQQTLTSTIVAYDYDVSHYTMTLSSSSYTYDGSAKKPTVTLKDADGATVASSNYSVTYSNNTNAGTATATVTGISPYTGSLSKNFTINKATPTIYAPTSAKYTIVSSWDSGIEVYAVSSGWAKNTDSSKELEGYNVLRSVSNVGKHSSASVLKLQFVNNCGSARAVTIKVGPTCESSYDYVFIAAWNASDISPTSTPSVPSSALYNGSGKTATWTDVSITIPAGINTLQIVYRKDSSASNSPDCGFIALPFAVDFKNCLLRVGEVASNITLSASSSSSSVVSSYSDTTYKAKVVGTGSCTLTISSPSTTNYYAASKSCSVSIVSDANANYRPSNVVDLCLPSGVLWAIGNIVKSQSGVYSIGSPTDDGCYFTWGSTEGYRSDETHEFSQDTYETSASQIQTNLPLSNDAARQLFGSYYRLPTKEELEELLDTQNIRFIDSSGNDITDQTDKMTSLNGVNGLYIKSKINNNKLFIPMAGYRYYSQKMFYGTGARAWTSTFVSMVNAKMLECFPSDNEMYPKDFYRYYGLSIRPCWKRE